MTLARVLSGLSDSLFPLLCGVGLTLGFPPTGYRTLGFFALVGLIGVIMTAPGWRRAAWRGWLFGFAHFVSGIYWVFISTHVHGGASELLAGFLVLLLAAYLAIYPALAAALATAALKPRGEPGRLLMLAVIPAAWVVGELLRGWVLGGFPWLSTGYAFIDTHLRDFAPYLGVHGVSAAALFFAAAFWCIFGESRPVRVGGLFAIVVGLPVLAMIPAPGNWTTPQGEPFRVALVQGNVSQDTKWDPAMRDPIERLYRELTDAVWHARLIIWPEVAVTRPYDDIEGGYLRALGNAARHNQSTVMLGVLHRDSEDGRVYNTAVMVGQDSGMYRKRHLVPFGEYFPVPGIFRPLLDVLNLPFSNLAAGPTGQTPLSVDGVPLAVSICFEDVFGHSARLDAREAQVLINLTNDAWFGDSSAAEQHLQIARMRSLESGRPLLRVASTGVSAVTDPTGKLLVRSERDAIDVITLPVQPFTGRTPYLIAGDWPVGILSLLMLAWGRAVRTGRLPVPPEPD